MENMVPSVSNTATSTRVQWRRTGQRALAGAAAVVIGLTLATPPLRAQSNISTLESMDKHMRDMEVRLKAAERRAASAEAMATEMEHKMGMTPATRGAMDYKGAESKYVVPEEEDKPLVTLGINYIYMRTAAATNDKLGTRNGGGNTAFAIPYVSDNSAGRLGNELDTYLEPSIKMTARPLRDSEAEFGAIFTLSSFTGQRTQIDLPTDWRVLDFYGYATKVIPGQPDAKVWAGRRGYVFQHYINIIDRRGMAIGGDGLGVDNIALGDKIKLDLAYLTGSPFGYGSIRTNNGNLNKQAFYARIHEIPTPLIGGVSSFHAQYVYTKGGQALSSGDFQGGGSFNNLNFSGADFGDVSGFSIGYVHDMKHDFANGNKLKNSLYVGAGWGADYITTNNNKLRASPYFGTFSVNGSTGEVTADTLQDAWAFKIEDQINLSIGKSWEFEAYAVYEKQDNARPTNLIDQIPIGDGTVTGLVTSEGGQRWFSTGLRAAYNLTPTFSIQTEATYNNIDDDLANATRKVAGFSSGSGQLYKLTIAPTLRYGKVGNYPIQMKVFYTYAWWNDNLKGSAVAGDAYANDTSGSIFGTQLEVSF